MSEAAMVLASAGAILVGWILVLQRSLYAASICLLAVVGFSSAFLFLSGAELLALLQVLIYAGAVMVVIVVAVMASRGKAPETWSRLLVPWPFGLLVILGPGVLVAILALLNLASMSAEAVDSELLAAQSRAGSVLFGTHVVATEAVSLLMFFAALALDRGSDRG